MENWKELIPGRIAEKYEFHNFNSALEILTQSYPEEFQDLVTPWNSLKLISRIFWKRAEMNLIFPKSSTNCCAPSAGKKLKFPES